jgi:hypothetical protein
MAGPYDKLPAGSPCTAFSITAWNRMLDMLRWWTSQQKNTGNPGSSAKRQPCIFDVQNNTGDNLNWLAVIGLDDVVFTPQNNLDGFRHKPMFKGVYPTVAKHLGKWGVIVSPCPVDGIEATVVAGVTPVRVYVNSTDDKFCDIIAKKTVSGEDCYLGTGASGAQILWLDPTATGSTIGWAIVRLGQGSGTSTQWFQLVRGACAGGNATGLTGSGGGVSIPTVQMPSYDSHFALANKLSLNTSTFKRYDPTTWNATDQAYDGPPIIDKDHSVCVVDTSLQLGLWVGDELEAVDTGRTIGIVTATGLLPLTGHESDSGVDQYEVWEITSRLSAETLYMGVMGPDTDNGNTGFLGWDGLYSWYSSQFATITINGINYKMTVNAGNLMVPNITSIGPGQPVVARYSGYNRCWYAENSTCT